MQMEIYSENKWQLCVIMNLVVIRRSIYELCFSIGVLVLGFFYNKENPGTPMIFAVSVCLWAILGFLREHNSHKKLERIYDKMPDSD